VSTISKIVERAQKRFPSSSQRGSLSSHKVPVFVAIVGGSASGKTWLALKLSGLLRGKTARLSQDSFYRDRSHLSPKRRATINFDHPASIDWVEFRRVLEECANGWETRVPVYDFKTHQRLSRVSIIKPKPIFLVDGLWLLRRPAIRAFFNLSIFLECPLKHRLKRRLQRDRLSRGRSISSIRTQFWNTVEPMHKRFVLPQRSRADLVFAGNWGEREAKQIAQALKLLIADP
jgi:uridine kinase